jgi:hypothetical protein
MKSAHKLLSLLVPLVTSLAALPAAGQGAIKEAPSSDAQKAFSLMKSLAGSWQGVVSTDPAMPEMGNSARMDVSLRVTSRGNALVHEMSETGKPDDPARYDHPVTVLYVEGERLMLTHYCDAGNRPRMAASASEDGKSVAFKFVDVSGPTTYGLMHDGVFTVIDANHHTEDWTFIMPGDKTVRVRMDLKRTK